MQIIKSYLLPGHFLPPISHPPIQCQVSQFAKAILKSIAVCNYNYTRLPFYNALSTKTKENNNETKQGETKLNKTKQNDRNTRPE